MGRGEKNSAALRLGTTSGMDGKVWDVCDILRRSNCASAIQYVPELTWILFLRILDERERVEAEAAEAVGEKYVESLESPYRWRDWAATPARMNGNCNGTGTLTLPSPKGRGKEPPPQPSPGVPA